ncbi:uncharacterized protein TNCV_4419041 [Trichonephila clavipes]|nr:uncharacterized protein TNCV_4419041 [Trichonephila clavipes]
MSLRRFRRRYEQLLKFERRRINGMMKAGWSTRGVARQLGGTNCVVSRCWDQWIREISFTRRPGSGRPQQTSRRKDHRIVRKRHVYIQLLQRQTSRHTRGPCVFPIRRRLAERNLESRRPLHVLPIEASVWSGAIQEETGLQRNETRSYLATKPD